MSHAETLESGGGRLPLRRDRRPGTVPAGALVELEHFTQVHGVDARRDEIGATRGERLRARALAPRQIHLAEPAQLCESAESGRREIDVRTVPIDADAAA